MMPSNLFTEPDTGADIPASSGNLGLGAESSLKRDFAPLQSQGCYIKGRGSRKDKYFLPIPPMDESMGFLG